MPCQPATVAAICARLEGLPRAIELAAARVGHLPLPAILARLEQRLAFLTGSAHDRPGRLRTLRNAMTWSYDLLTADEQRLLRALTIFRGGFTLNAAEDGGGRPDGLASLLDKSLLRLNDATDEPRHRKLETVREFAFEQLEARGEVDQAQRNHARHMLALAERAGPEWWGREPERPALRLRTSTYGRDFPRRSGKYVMRTMSGARAGGRMAVRQETALAPELSSGNRAMVTHPDSYTAFAFVRHQELLAEAAHERQAVKAASRPARPRRLRAMRAWLSATVNRRGASRGIEPWEPVAPRAEADGLLPSVTR